MVRAHPILRPRSARPALPRSGTDRDALLVDSQGRAVAVAAEFGLRFCVLVAGLADGAYPLADLPIRADVLAPHRAAPVLVVLGDVGWGDAV